MKILVVEDEPKTGTYLRQRLVEAGFVVDLAMNGLDGLHLASTESYDLAILDVMLPGSPLDAPCSASIKRIAGSKIKPIERTINPSVAVAFYLPTCPATELARQIGVQRTRRQVSSITMPSLLHSTPAVCASRSKQLKRCLAALRLIRRPAPCEQEQKD